MNKTYRLVWNTSANAFVAVAECCRAKGKGGARGSALVLAGLVSTLLASAAALAAPGLTELPTSGKVVAGSASITGANGQLSIQQSTTRAAIDWQSFNVGAQAQVQFLQPSAASVTLNRVLGGQPSEILGRIQANGQVFLVNPSGVYFGQGASVDVGALVATTHSISNADFMAGKNTFARHGSTGSVVNEGQLRAALEAGLGGYIALMAPEVRNQGVIVAQLGAVALASGESITLDISGSHTLAGLTVSPSQIKSLVDNQHLIEAPGGLIILSAQAANALQGGVVNNSGRLEATGLVEHGGKIVLESSGVVNNTGVILANASAGIGGSVTLTGEQVTVLDASRIEAIGVRGGGLIQVGGSWQNSNPLVRQASSVLISKDAVLDASASQNGDGGTVVAWSDIHNPVSQTRVYGQLLARGGAQGGDGGRIETSGHWLDLGGLTANASAAQGKAGVWLLDPSDLVVSAAPTNTPVDPFAPPGFFVSNTGFTNVLNTDIEAVLNSGTDVVLQTGGLGSTGNGDILINANIVKTLGTDASLNLIADRHIVLDNNIVISSTSGQLNTLLQAATGSIILNAGSSILSNGSIVLLAANQVNLDATASLSGTGFLSIAPNNPGTTIGIAGGAGTLQLPASYFLTNFVAGFTDVVVGDGLSGAITVGAAIAPNDALTLTSASNIQLDGNINASGKIVTLSGRPGSVISGSGSITAAGLMLDGTGASFNLSTAPNNLVTTLAAGDAGLGSQLASVAFANNQALTIGTVDVFNGVNSSGPVSIWTNTGDLTVAKSVTTTDASVSAVTLNAGEDAVAGTAAGGNLVFTGGSVVTTGAGGTATLYSGSVANSTGLTALVGSGSGRFRYSSDEATSNFSAALSTGLNAIYRESPDLTYQPIAVASTYGTAFIPGGTALTAGTFQNSDTSAGTVGGSIVSTGSAASSVGPYDLSITGLPAYSSLGYSLTGASNLGGHSINKAPLTVTADNQTRLYGAANPTLTTSVSGFVNGETAFTAAGYTGAGGASTTADTSTNVGFATIFASAGTLAATNYDFITLTNGTLTINPAPLTVTADNQARLYGAANPALTTSVSGFVNGETALTAAGYTGSGSASTAATPTTSVGTATITASAGTLAATNYDFSTLNNGTLTINPAPLTVAANDAGFAQTGSAYFGGNGVVYNGFVNGEASNVLGGTLSYSGTSQGAIDPGTYTITPGGLSSSNYALVFTNGTLTISPTATSSFTPLPISVTTPARANSISNSEIAGPTITQGQNLLPTDVAGSVPFTISDQPAANPPATLTPASLAAMSIEQIREITPAQIASLDAQALQALQPFQLSALTKQQVQAFSTQQVQQLNLSQFQAMVPQNFVRLSLAQVTALLPAARRDLLRLAAVVREFDGSPEMDFRQANEFAQSLVPFMRQLQLSEEFGQRVAAMPWNPALAKLRNGEWPTFPGMKVGMVRVADSADNNEPLVRMAAEIGDYFSTKTAEKLFRRAEQLAPVKRLLQGKAARTLLESSPIVGNLLSLYTVTTGKDAFTSETVNDVERALAVLGTVPGGGVLLKVAGRSSVGLVQKILLKANQGKLTQIADVGELAVQLVAAFQAEAATVNAPATPEITMVAQDLFTQLTLSP